MEVYFQYGEKEIEHLKKRDKQMAEVIEKVGKIERVIIPDLFTALVKSIVGQQISAKAQKTIWERIKNELGEITPGRIDNLALEALQKFGISFRKASYIKSAAQKIISGKFDMDALQHLPDDEVCARLSELDGVGAWTAEMLMIFSMQRPDVLSFGDLAIQRGMRMVYRHKNIDRAKFERYKKRYSPYASVADLYLWAVSGGNVEGYEDLQANQRRSKIAK